MTHSEQKRPNDPYVKAEQADRESRTASAELRATKRAFERLLGIHLPPPKAHEEEPVAQETYFLETHTIFFGGIYPHLTHINTSPHPIEPEEVFYIGPLESKAPALTGESGFLLRFRATNLGDPGTHSYVMWLSRLASGGSYDIQIVGVKTLEEPENVSIEEDQLDQAM